MSLKRVFWIAEKDFRDAGRDGRVIILLLLPVLFAIGVKAITPKPGERDEATVAVVSPGGGDLGAAVTRAARRTAEVTVTRADDEAAARRLLDRDKADLAVIGQLPQGDAPPRAVVLLPPGAATVAESVVAVVPDAVAAAASRPPASEVEVRPYRVDASLLKPADALDRRAIQVGLLIAMLVTMIGLVVVPIQTAEELETGTLGALRLAASGGEVLAAKVLAGVVYSAIVLVATVQLSDQSIDDPLRFYTAALGLSLSTVAFGVMLGLVVRNATAINTYGTFLLFPVLAVTVAVLFVTSGPLEVVLDLLPFGQASKLMFDGMTPLRPFDAGAGAWIVLVVWIAVAYAALTRLATRREV